MNEPYDIEPATPISESTRSAPDDPAAPHIGRWYYVKTKDEDNEGHIRGKKTWLGCVTHIGSNYVELMGVGSKYSDNQLEGSSTRIHFDEFDSTCIPADDAADVIQRRVLKHKNNVRELIGEIRDLTARLGVGVDGKPLPGGGETHAISVRSSASDEAIHEYKKALIKAKDKTLPQLFEKLKYENKWLAIWMRAETLPLLAEVGRMKESIQGINQRIFSVELYAGLTESIVEITDPEAPAAHNDTPIHLMQRRHYMDEECLANYEAGGMDWKSVRDFYEWLARPDNRDRILPHQRCIVAFRIRRNRKLYEGENWFAIAEEHQANQKTYLFIRNGEKLFALATAIEFDEQLFPDGEHSDFTGKLWMQASPGHIWNIITDNQYKGFVEERDAALAKWKIFKKLPKKEREKHPDRHLYFPFNEPRIERGHDPDAYTLFEPNNICYDDAVEYIQKRVNEHNRLVLVLQGLLDRSPVLHPHPPYQLWRPDGFAQALRLVYDDSRALAPSEKPPNFEAYRRKLNESITVGTVTVGQKVAWREDDEEQYRREHFRHRGTGYYGPNNLGRVVKVTKKRGEKKGITLASFAWKRERTTPIIVEEPIPKRPGWVRKRHTYPKIPMIFTCSTEHLLNVDAYKPGDFKQFFADPRTRADYLQWAPLLLVAEDYHAGVRKIEEEDDDE